MESMLYKKKWPLIIFLSPTLIFMAVFLFYPFGVNIYNSFFDISALGGKVGAFNNYENYKMLFTDEKIVEALRNTAIIMVLGVIFQVGMALLLSILVDAISKGSNFFKTVYFFPIVISSTAIGLMFYLIYMSNGALDQLVMFFGVETPPYWLGEGLAYYMIIIPILWQYVGFYFVILLTGLNNISEEVYEAASIDGATGFQRVRLITLPLLRSVIVTCVILSVTGSLKVFDMPWTILPNGAQGTFFTGTYMYFVTFIKSNIDYGSTIAILIVVLGVLTATLCNFLFTKKED